MDNSELNKNRIDYLKQTHSEVRTEIMERIKQRDSFAIQFVVGIGAILTIGFLEFKYSPFLFYLLPLLGLFYSIQILYSYTIHDRCHKFLSQEIEPEIAKLLEYEEGTASRLLWEKYCDNESKKIKVKAPGIRKKFFEIAIFVIPPLASALFFGLAYARNLYDWKVLLIIALSTLVVFELISALLIIKFNRRSK